MFAETIVPMLATDDADEAVKQEAELAEDILPSDDSDDEDDDDDIDDDDADDDDDAITDEGDEDDTTK